MRILHVHFNFRQHISLLLSVYIFQNNNFHHVCASRKSDPKNPILPSLLFLFFIISKQRKIRIKRKVHEKKKTYVQNKPLCNTYLNPTVLTAISQIIYLPHVHVHARKDKVSALVRNETNSWKEREEYFFLSLLSWLASTVNLLSSSYVYRPISTAIE